MSDKDSPKREVLIVGPEQGRKYGMGRMRAVFFADGEETDSRYSISEWWLEPRTEGPGAHDHPEDHIFYVLVGTLSLFIEGERTDAGPGTYALIPGGTNHTFKNHGEAECGFISINVPAGFEQTMPHIVKWFEANPLGELGADVKDGQEGG